MSGLWLQWPRIYQPTPDDLFAIVNALKAASTPAEVSAAGAAPGSKPLVVPALLDSKIASAYLEANMDLGILDDTDDGPAAGAPGSDPTPTPSASSGTETRQEGPFWNIYAPIKFPR